MDKLDKIDFLFNLVEEMEGISFDEVLEKVLVNGFSMIHPTFHFYLNSDEKYVDVIYDMEKKIITLVDTNEKVSEGSQGEKHRRRRNRG